MRGRPTVETCNGKVVGGPAEFDRGPADPLRAAAAAAPPWRFKGVTGLATGITPRSPISVGVWALALPGGVACRFGAVALKAARPLAAGVALPGRAGGPGTRSPGSGRR